MYGNYYGYAPAMQDNFPQARQTQQANNSGLTWVQGESGAKSFLVAPGASVLLMDSENTVFYIKSADASGMPMPLRIFDYKERTASAEKHASADFVTREEFEKAISELKNKEESEDA